MGELDYEAKTLSSVRDILLRSAETIALPVISESMAPFIKPHDAVLITSVTDSEIASGDIAIFETQGGLCAHRLIRKRSGSGWTTLTTKPDISWIADPPFDGKKLFGRVTAIQRQGRIRSLKTFPWKLINRCLGMYHIYGYAAVCVLKSIRNLLFKKPRHA